MMTCIYANTPRLVPTTLVHPFTSPFWLHYVRLSCTVPRTYICVYAKYVAYHFVCLQLLILLYTSFALVPSRQLFLLNTASPLDYSLDVTPYIWSVLLIVPSTVDLIIICELVAIIRGGYIRRMADKVVLVRYFTM